MGRPRLRAAPGRIGAQPRRRPHAPRFLTRALALVGVLVLVLLLVPLLAAIRLPASPAGSPAPSSGATATPAIEPAAELGPQTLAGSTGTVGSIDPGGLPVGDTLPGSDPAAQSAEPEALSGYQWPLHNARVTTWYAPTDDGFVMVDGQRIHDGIDLATFCGDTVRAAHGGRVIYAGRRFDPYLGYVDPPDAYFETLKADGLPATVLPIVVVVDDGNGYRSIYVHLASTLVTAGATVRAGQALGREGMTGHATGCHLHYGLIRMDGPYVPVAPALVAKWHYPAWVRTRVDPLRVLDPFAPGAARELPGLPPPTVSPGGPTHAELLATWLARQPPHATSPAEVVAPSLRGR